MSIGIGIDIGASALRAVIVERTGASQRPRTGFAVTVNVLAAREIACDTANLEALTRALTQLRQSLRINQPIILGVPSTAAIVTTVNPLVTSPKRAGLAVRFELQQILPFQAGEAAWHYQWLSATNGNPGKGRSGFWAWGSGGTPPAPSPQPPASSIQPGAVVAAMKHARLDEWLACCRRAGLGVRAVAISPIAILNAWCAQRGEASASTTALLHLIDSQNAEWMFWTPASLQVMPVSSVSADTLGQELIASWESCRTQLASPPTSVSAIGTADQIRSIEEPFAAQTTLRLERFDPNTIVAANSNRLEQPDRMVAALGLGLQGIGFARLALNLLASRQGAEQLRRIRRNAMIVSGICGLAVVGLAVSGMVEIHHRKRLMLQVFERRERLYQSLRSDVRAVLQRQQRTERRSRQLAGLVGEASLVSQLLLQVADALPETTWLTKAECTKNGAVQLVLEGRAKTFQEVTQFMERLKSLGGTGAAVKPISTSVIKDQESEKEVIAFAVQVERMAGSREEPAGASAPPRSNAVAPAAASKMRR